MYAYLYKKKHPETTTEEFNETWKGFASSPEVEVRGETLLPGNGCPIEHTILRAGIPRNVSANSSLPALC